MGGKAHGAGVGAGPGDYIRNRDGQR